MPGGIAGMFWRCVVVARRKAIATVPDATETEFLTFAAHTIRRRLAVMPVEATPDGEASQARGHMAIRWADAAGGNSDDPALRFTALRAAAAELFGEEVPDGWVRSAVASRSRWAPAGDWSVAKAIDVSTAVEGLAWSHHRSAGRDA